MARRESKARRSWVDLGGREEKERTAACKAPGPGKRCFQEKMKLMQGLLANWGAEMEANQGFEECRQKLSLPFPTRTDNLFCKGDACIRD